MPSLSESEKPSFPPHHQTLQQPKHFEFGSIREVPDSHAWPDLHDHPSADPGGPESVPPVIDLTSPVDAVPLIGKACEEWGLFQVTGHGVSAALLARLEAQTRRLFALPTEHKLRAARTTATASGYGLVPISSFFPKLMWSEGFLIAGSPLDHARKLWPNDYKEFCDVVEEYTKEMKKLAVRLTHLMLLSLGLTKEDISQAGPIRNCDEVEQALQLNWYPACPEPDRAMGIAAHTDSGLLTVLYQNQTRGLQVLRPEGKTGPAQWVTVPPLPATFIVNMGDLTHVLSNGRFHSVRHRGLVNRTEARLSVAYFCGPLAHVKVAPVDKLIGPNKRPAYRAVTWPELKSLKGKMFDQAISAIKL